MISAESYFVSAIGTDSGKTLVSAILVNALKAVYWKPIQCGFPKDSDTIKELTNGQSHILPDGRVFKTPASPHFAARKEDQYIHVSEFKLPNHNGPMIVEGAGGLMVPINDNETMAELILQLQLPLVLVINHYLGSLNHSLLTLEVINVKKIPLAGIVFNGVDFQDAEPIILKRTNAPVLFRLPTLESVNSKTVGSFSQTLTQN